MIAFGLSAPAVAEAQEPPAQPPAAKPPAAKPVAFAETHRPDTPGRSHLAHGPRLELALGAITPVDATLDPEFTTALSAEAVGVGFEPIGIAVGYGLTFGLNGDANAYFDARAAVGPGLRIGPLMLAPMLGLGVDLLGGDDPATYRFDAAPYWYAEARLRLEGGVAGVEQSVSRAARGSLSKAASDAPSEIRLVSRVFVLFEDYYELSLGFAYTDYESADSVGGLLGAAF